MTFASFTWILSKFIIGPVDDLARIHQIKKLILNTVKVFQLNEDLRRWDYRGTGHVQVHKDASNHTCSLLVKSETDQSVLLDSEIRTNTNYFNQQETLIEWSEDNPEQTDRALSFQDISDCEEVGLHNLDLKSTTVLDLGTNLSATRARKNRDNKTI